MVVEFRGAPPHDLGTAELATVHAANEHVEVELHILDDWHRPTASIVRVQMGATVARSLAERLAAAAAEVDARAARSA
jgi:hypothetical protein